MSDERVGGVDASADVVFPPSGDATTNDDSSVDAPFDAMPDAQLDAPPDAVADAGSDAPLGFCQALSPAPSFCADFDDAALTDPATGWNGSTVGSGSVLSLVNNPFFSSPRSMRAQTTSGSAATVDRSFAMSTQISIELEVRFAALPADGSPLSPILLTPPTFPGFDIYWFVDANNSYFQEFGDDFSASQAQPSTTAWHKLSLSLTTNGTTSTIDASVDGTAYWTDHVLAHPWPTMTTATLRVGAARAYATNNDVFIDDVIVKVN